MAMNGQRRQMQVDGVATGPGQVPGPEPVDGNDRTRKDNRHRRHVKRQVDPVRVRASGRFLFRSRRNGSRGRWWGRQKVVQEGPADDIVSGALGSSGWLYGLQSGKKVRDLVKAVKGRISQDS